MIEYGKIFCPDCVFSSASDGFGFPMSFQPSCDGHTLIPEDASCLAAKGGPERGELAFKQHVRVVQQDLEGRYLFLSFESSAGGCSPSFHPSELSCFAGTPRLAFGCANVSIRLAEERMCRRCLLSMP